MAQIVLNNAHVVYPIRNNQGMTLKEFLLREVFRHERPKMMTNVEALKGIDLEIGDGARLGIIGHNGAGKSTLLRTIAGVYPLAGGRREVVGRVCSLFELTLGFEIEVPGRENIRFRGYLQGETPRSMRRKSDEIIEFSELGDFIDIPMKCYSSGMVMRLAFAIATSADPEILLIDEVFSVGDLSFQKKAQVRMQEMMSRARIIVMAGHDLATIANFCDQTMWLDHGRVRQVGAAPEVITAYKESVSGPSATAA